MNMESHLGMTVEEAIHTLWEYHHVHHTLTPADLVFVLGSNDPRVATYAASLYHKGLAPRLVFSGGVGRFTGEWSTTEADHFAQVAQQAGVPEHAILIENQATNTGENIKFTRTLLTQHSIANPARIIALQKPYMERRTLATLQAQWRGPEFMVSSPSFTFEDYLTPVLTHDLVVNAIVGDFQRIVEYPKRGFSTLQPVTQQARQAFEVLVQHGYTTQLL